MSQIKNTGLRYKKWTINPVSGYLEIYFDAETFKAFVEELAKFVKENKDKIKGDIFIGLTKESKKES